MAHVALIQTRHKSSVPLDFSHIATDSSGALDNHEIDISIATTIDSLPEISHHSEEDDDPTYNDHSAYGISTEVGDPDLEDEYYSMEFDDGHSNLQFFASPRYWACVGIVYTLGQAVTAIVMLLLSQESLSDKEAAGTPLRIWLVGYTMGCITSLPVAAWKLFYHKRQHHHDNAIEYNQHSQYHRTGYEQRQQIGNDQQRRMLAFRRGRRRGRSVMKVWLEKLETSLDFFFAVWFVLGNVWVFGRPSLALQTPSLYRLCVAFLALSCVSYALPLLVCAALCCCMPCFAGRRSDGGHRTPPASPGAIAALPFSQFRRLGPAHLKSCDEDSSDTESNYGSGFILDAANQTPRLIQADDAVCCICLRRYKQDIEIKTLPCSHHFHLQCVDQWLQIKAICPLCKAHVENNTMQEN